MITWLLKRNYHRWNKIVGWLQWNDFDAWYGAHPQILYNVRIHRATLMLFYVTVIILGITAATLILTVMQLFCPEQPLPIQPSSDTTTPQ